MKKSTKLLSFLLALTLILGVAVLAPIGAAALDDGEFYYSVEDGEATILGLVDEDDLFWSLDIPSTIGGSPVTAIGDEAFKGLGELDELTLPDGLKSIGTRAFYETEIYSYVVCPDSIVSIGDEAFGFGQDPEGEYCAGLVGKDGSAVQTYCQANDLTFIDVEKYTDPDYNASVSLIKVNDQGNPAMNEQGELQERYQILHYLEVGDDLPEGVSFDLDTFTLTLNDFRRSDIMLRILTPSKNFVTVEVIGECELSDISAFSTKQGARIRFDGDGILTVNAREMSDYGIWLNTYSGYSMDNLPCVTFGKNVKMRVYGKEGAIRTIGVDGEYNPFIAENGSEIECETEIYCYEDSQSVEGYIAESNLPNSEYPKILGERVVNANDPDGLYCSPDEGDTVQRCFYDEANDICVLDYTEPAVDWDGAIHAEVWNKYGKLEEVRTKTYYPQTFCRVRALDGNEYLIPDYDYEWLDTAETESMFCNGYRFSYVGSAVDSNGYRYAIADGEPEYIELSGHTGTEGMTELLETVTMLEISTDRTQYLVYRAECSDDPNGVYGYYYNDEDEIWYVTRYLYNEELNHYFADSGYEDVEMDEESFSSQFEPVLDNNGEHIWVENSERLVYMYADLYTDDDGVRYACNTVWNSDTQKSEFTGVYYMTEIPEASTEDTVMYCFEPVDINDMAPDFTDQLRRVKEIIETDYYTYIVPSVFEYGFGPPDEPQMIETLDVGNVWTFNLISGNPDCAPCYIPFTAEVNPDFEGAYVEDEIWTNVTDGSTSSRKAPKALKPGYTYTYTMVVNAEPGYRFSDDLALTYLGENAPNAILTLSEDKNTLTITGLEKVTFLLDQPALSVAADYNGVKVTIAGVKGAIKYRVYRKEGNGSWAKLIDTATLSFIDKTAVSSKKYTYTVRCLSADSKRFESGYDAAGKAITYVAAPRLTSFDNVNTGTRMTWKAVKGAVWYRVFVRDGNKWSALGDTKATVFVATKRTSGVKYTYTVRAMDANKRYVSAYNANGWKYTFVAAPARPRLANTRNGVQITYTKPAGGVYFRIFRKQAGKGWVKIADTSSTRVIDKTAKKGVRYYYTVRCISKDGKQYYSGYNTTGSTIVCVR